MATRNPLAILVSVLSAASLFAATPVYVNDFTTRTSQNPIPAYGAWMEDQPYPAPCGRHHVRERADMFPVCRRGTAGAGGG